MRLHRFFVNERLVSGKEIRLDDSDLIHQWKNVFRLSKGDGIVLLDNSGFSHQSEIVMLSKNEAVVSVGEQEEVTNIPTKKMWLFAALPKKDKFEWILEKGTELGVSHFVPVVSERSEKKDLNMERSAKIIKEAAEQSYRGTLPELLEVHDLKQSIDLAKTTGSNIIAFHLEGEAFSLEKYKSVNPIMVFVGPEGGWSDSEVLLFKANNIPLVTLGYQVLKAETAAIAAAALLLL